LEDAMSTSSIVVAAQALESAQARTQRTVERAEAKVKKLREALAAAEEQLRVAEAEATRVQQTIQAVLDAAAAYRLASPKAKAVVAPPMKAAAQVTTDAGEVRPLSPEVARKVRQVIGRRQSGVLEPLDGEDAQAILTALDEGGNVGDVFTVAIGRRKVQFSVEEEGLRFQTVS
jgi:hypothetical protein